jgi:glycerol-3-phosphate acyltransferase PlsY
MSSAQWLAILAPAAYLMGSIPFGLIVGLSKGVDPRKAGSGNIGATNVGRLLGAKFFAIVFLLDMFKGLLPTLAASFLIGRSAATAGQYWMWLAVAFAAIAGHMFSIFLKLKGGKGVATSLGAALGVWPFYTLAGVAAGVVWALIFWRTRIVSIASIAAAVVFPVAYIAIGLWNGWPVFGAQWPLLAFASFIALMITYKHRSNIKRLIAGTENRFVPSPSTPRESSLSKDEG